MKITWEEQDVQCGIRINNDPRGSGSIEFPDITQDSIISHSHEGAVWLVVHMVTGGSETFATRADLADYLNQRGYFPYIEIAGKARMPSFER